MPSLVVLGASGFLGKVVIEQASFSFFIKAVARQLPLHKELYPNKVCWYEANLLEPNSLDNILGPGDVVINLAYMNSVRAQDNFCLINNIINSCIKNNVKKLIHISTANVVGITNNPNVNELTSCQPLTPYEQVKYEIEHQVLGATVKGLDVNILRPTAIVGADGENLKKLANSLVNGNKFVNYLRACFFGKRKMHLVSVRTVAAAVLHLGIRHDLQSGSIYFVSADDDSLNNFLSVEEILIKTLNLPPRRFPVFIFPRICLSILLKLKRKSESVVRVYDSTKLLATNFTPNHTLSAAINEFATQWSKKGNPLKKQRE